MSERDWSDHVAELAVDALVRSGIVDTGDLEGAIRIVAEEIRVRLCLGDYPPPSEGEPGQLHK